MERLDLRLVEYFVAVAEELHFGRAAARLHIAQPSLSHQIRHLEAQLGVLLLNRTSRRVELTPAGETLLRQGRVALRQSHDAIRLTRAAGREKLTVGFYGSASSGLLGEVLRSFALSHPDIDVSLRELELSHVAGVLDSEIDVAFTRLHPEETEAEVEIFEHQPRLVALPASHPLARRRRILFSDLREESFITQPAAHNPAYRARWLAEQKRHGLPGRISGEAASVQEILTLVGAGRGVCLVPSAAAELYPRPDVGYVLVRDAEPSVVSLAWKPGTLRPEVGAFITTARNVAARRHESKNGAE